MTIAFFGGPLDGRIEAPTRDDLESMSRKRPAQIRRTLDDGRTYFYIAYPPFEGEVIANYRMVWIPGFGFQFPCDTAETIARDMPASDAG